MNYSGLHTFPEQNPKAWKWVIGSVVGGVTVGLLLVGLILGVTGQAKGYRLPLFIGISLFGIIVIVAILLPIALTNMKKTVSIDFDRGLLFSGTIALHPSQFVAIVHERRHIGPDVSGPDTILVRYANGAAAFKLFYYGDTAEIQARNEALIAFIWQWLPVPDHCMQSLSRNMSTEEWLIGKYEALALLRRGPASF